MWFCRAAIIFGRCKLGVYGQDWASYQGTYPPATGLAFVFIKITEGESYVNPYWQSQAGDALKAGAAIGKYHYPHMHNSVPGEIDYFLTNAMVKPGEMVVLDWEGYDANNSNLSNAEKLAYKEQFLSLLKQRLPNNPVGMYCNLDYWYNVDTTGHAGDFLWIATAGRNAGDPGIKAPWKFHQYSDNPVDKDYGNFNSVADLKNWINSFNKTNPTPPPVEDDLPYTEAQLRAIVNSEVVKAVTSQPVRDELAFANLWFLQEVFSMKPVAATNSNATTVNALQTELKAVLGQLDPSVVAQLQTAIENAVKNTAITATVEVNGKAV